jgi:GDP-L-fucose synthase
MWGTGTSRREFLHVDDLADACLFLMEHYDSPEIINVGNGVDLTIRELTEKMKATVGFEGRITHDITKPDGTLQ